MNKWKIGDKIRHFNNRGGEETTEFLKPSTHVEICMINGCINLSEQGRKAAKATKSKIIRNNKTGRFEKRKDYYPNKKILVDRFNVGPIDWEKIERKILYYLEFKTGSLNNNHHANQIIQLIKENI